jgi:hypothetical protein
VSVPAQARPPVALAEFEVVPLGSMGSGNWPLTGLVLGDDLAKNLPEERVFETDGVGYACLPCLYSHAFALHCRDLAYVRMFPCRE